MLMVRATAGTWVITQVIFSTRHYPGTRTRKITTYVYATFVQLK